MTVKPEQSEKNNLSNGRENGADARSKLAVRAAAVSGVWLLLKLFLIVSMLAAAVPFCWFVEAMIWRYLLAQVDGISFVGGLWSAFAFSAALGGFIACANLLAAFCVDSYKKLHKIAIEKPDPLAAVTLKSWTDLCAKVPGVVAVGRQFGFKILGLLLLSFLQPLSLHFDNAFALILAAAVLTATWVSFMFLFNLSTALLLRNTTSLPGQSLPPSSRQI